MARYGRRGEEAPNARLTNVQAEEARREFTPERGCIARLARRYRCSYATMWRIIHRLTYRGPDRFRFRALDRK
jgi:hypothetical protein